MVGITAFKIEAQPCAPFYRSSRHERNTTWQVLAENMSHLSELEEARLAYEQLVIR